MAGIPAENRMETARLAALAALTIGAPYALAQSAGGALFLVSHGAAALPLLYLGVSALSIALGLLWLRFDWLDLVRLAPILTVARAVAMAGLGLFLMVGPAAEASIAAAIWARVDFAFGVLIFAGLSNKRMGGEASPQARAIFGGAEAMALALVGGAIPFLLVVAAPAELYLAAGAAITAGLLLLPRSGGSLFVAAPQVAAVPHAPDQAARRRLSRSLRGYLALISALMLAASAAHYLIDATYLRAAAEAAPEVDDLTALLALVLAVSGLFSAVVAGLGGRRFVARFGPRLTLWVAPAAVALLAALTLAVDAVFAAATPILILLAAMKAAERATMREMHRPALRAVLQPTPDTHRARMTQWAEMLARPLFVGVTALGLLALSAVTPPSVSVAATLLIAISAVWAGLIYAVHLGYVASIERALSRRQGLGEIARVAERRSREMIQSILRRGVAGDVIGAARIQAALDPDGFANTAPQLIARGEPDVVRQLVGTVKEIAAPDFYPPMYGRLSIENDPDVRDALLTAVAATGHPKAPQLLAKALAESPEAPPMGALVGLGRHGGAFGAAIAGQFLERRALESDAGLALALEAITAIGPMSPSGPVAAGLRSADRAVRRAAIRAAGHLSDPMIAPLVVERLADPRERRAAQLALVGMGPAAVDALAVAAGERTRAPRERAAAILSLGAIPAPRARDQVLRYLDMRRLSLQAAAALALWRAGYIAPRDKTDLMLKSSRAMLATAAEIALARTALAPLVDPLLDRALAAAAERAVTRSVRVGGLLRFRGHQDAARLSGHFGERSDQAQAKAMAADYLPAALRPVLATLRQDPSPARDAALRAFVGEAPDSAEDWLVHIVLSTPWATDFLRAFCFDAFAKLRPEDALTLADRAEAVGPILTNAIESLAAQVKGEPAMSLSTIETVLVLKTSDLFSQVPEEDLAEMAPYLASLHLDPDEEVVRQGDIGDELYILVSGEVQVIRDGEIIGVMEDGAVFGDLAALDPEPRAATIVTTRPSHVLALSNEHLMALFETNMEIASGVISVLVRRLRKASGY